MIVAGGAAVGGSFSFCVFFCYRTANPKQKKTKKEKETEGIDRRGRGDRWPPPLSPLCRKRATENAINRRKLKRSRKADATSFREPEKIDGFQ